VCFFNESLFLDLLLHLHESLEFEPLPDLLFPPSLFLLASTLLRLMSLLLRYLLLLLLPVLLVILPLLVPHALPLLLGSLPLCRVLLAKLLILRRVIC
jgi:hypothetical protein